MWSDSGTITVAVGRHRDARGTLQVGRTGRAHPFADAQNHVPACYCQASGLLSAQDVRDLQAWFCDERSGLETTTFDGEAIPADDAPDVDEGPRVRQLYRRPAPFRTRFGEVFERLLDLKDRVGEALGLPPDELAEMDFANDIRHITYLAGHECPFHCDDPRSTFNIVMLLSRPEVDFAGGAFQVHPGPLLGGSEPRSLALQQGDAIIYTASKVDHGVQAVTEGIRQICLVELRRRSVAFPQINPLVPSLLDTAAAGKAASASAPGAAPARTGAAEPTASANANQRAFRAAFVHRRERPDLRWDLELRLRREALAAVRVVARSALPPSPRANPSACKPGGGAVLHADRASLAAVAAAHRSLWSHAARWREEAPPLLVLEAGAALCDGFQARCAAVVAAVTKALPTSSEQAVVLCVGGEATGWTADGPRGGFVRGQQRVREARGVRRACAYLIFPAAARALAELAPDEHASCDELLSKGATAGGRVRLLVAVPALAW